MTVFRPTITRTGIKSKANTWSIRYRDSNGKPAQENGFLTKDEAAVRLRDARREVKEERAGIRTKKFKQHEKPLAEHLADFEQSLEDREISPAQRQLVSGRLILTLASPPQTPRIAMRPESHFVIPTRFNS